MGHLEDNELEAYWQGRLAPAEQNRVLRHLVVGCAACWKRFEAAKPPSKDPTEGLYEASLERGFRAARRLATRAHGDQERIRKGLELLRERGGWRGVTLEEKRLYQGHYWWTIEVQLRYAFELRYSDPKAMLSLTQTAVHWAEDLKPGGYGEGFVLDLQARALAELGNAWRVNENYGKAEAALSQARERWQGGSGDPMLRARIDDFEASLRRAQQRFDDALRLLARVHRAYLRLGERHLAGRALIKKGYTLQVSDQPNEAIQTLRRAMKLLDPERDPRFTAGAIQNLALALIDAGRPAEAGRLLLESDLRRKLQGDSQQLLRVRWVEARLLAARDRLEDAERALGDVRAGFRERGLAYDEALAGMDLAAVLLRQDKVEIVHRLALELHAAFVEHQIHPEATLALTAFEICCRRRTASADLAQRVRRFLADFQICPTLQLSFGS